MAQPLYFSLKGSSHGQHLLVGLLHLYRNPMITEFTFFSNKVERWKRDLVTLWGNFDICPHLNHLDLPGPSPAELISVSSFKVWGNTWNLRHDMAYLLVCLGNTTEEGQYGVSLVWVNPNQTRASTMEEAVEKLATCPPMEATGLMPWCNYMRVLAMHHSPRENTWASCLRERWRKPPVGRSVNSTSASSFLPVPKSSIPQV